MIVIDDWRPPIIEMVMAKRALAEWDPDGIFPNHLPELAAEPEAIESAEAALGVILDGEHRRFLSFADGWKCFHQNVSLFGTQELVDGPLRAAALQSFEYAPELLEDYGWSPALLLPIAASLEQADVFVMPVGDRGRVDPRVHWLAEGELIDTFETFGQFFVSMIDHTRYRVAKLRESAPPFRGSTDRHMIDAQKVTKRVAAGVGVSSLPSATTRVDATPGSSRAVGMIEVPDQPDEGVTTWATVQASRFASGYRTNDGRPIGVEFIAAVDAGLTVFGDAVAAAAFQVGPPNDVRPGTVYRNAVKDRYSEASTPHLMSVPPFLWAEFVPYSDEDVYVTWLQLIPVSEAEAEFCVTRGFGALDEAFERAQPDLFSIERPSVELPRGQ